MADKRSRAGFLGGAGRIELTERAAGKPDGLESDVAGELEVDAFQLRGRPFDPRGFEADAQSDRSGLGPGQLDRRDTPRSEGSGKGWQVAHHTEGGLGQQRSD